MQVGTQSEPPLLARYLAAVVSAVCRRPRAVLAVAVAATAISLYASAFQLGYQTQRTDLISANKDCQRRWRQYVATFGEDDDIVVVVKREGGSDRHRMRQALDQIAEAARAHPTRLDRVFHQVDLRNLSDRALLFLPIDQIRRIRHDLERMNLLLGVGTLGWRNLTMTSLLVEAGARVTRIEDGATLTPDDQTFFRQLQSVCLGAAAAIRRSEPYANPWNRLVEPPAGEANLLDEPLYFFSSDGTLAFLLARPIKDASSFTSAAASVELMRQIVADTQLQFDDLSIGLTGLPVLETDEMAAADRDTRRASWLAIGGVTLLFFVVYRGVCYPLLTVTTLLIGTAWAMGWTTLTVGHLNILSATFAVMLIGMGDYGVLWVMRYEAERRRGCTVEDSLKRTAICVGAGTLTAAITTAVAFYAAMLADFKAVAELGWIAGSGVLLCALACFTVLPAVLTIFDRRTFAEASEPILILRHPRFAISSETWLPSMAGQSRWILIGGLALTVLLAACATRVGYDHNLLHLQAQELDSVRWEKTLLEHTAGASWHAISYTQTAEQALAMKARYETLPEVSRVVEIASLVPSQQMEKLDLLRDIQSRLRRLPEKDQIVSEATTDVDAVIRAAAVTAAAIEATPAEHRPALLRETLAAIQGLHDSLQTDAAASLREFENRMAGDLLGDLQRLRCVSHPVPIQLVDLPPGLRERFIGRNGEWKVQVFARDSLWDFEPLERFVNQIQTIDAEATGKPFTTVEGLTAMKHGFIRAGIYALLAIVTVLFFDFRNFPDVCVAISPLLIGLVWALGMLGLVGIPLNPANMIALPLVLGVGVDNGVHIVHDFLARKSEGAHQLSKAIGRGVLVKALTTIIGFGTLMISSQPGLSGLGLCLTLGVACCMASSLVILPALLQLARRPETEISPSPPQLRRLAA